MFVGYFVDELIEGYFGLTTVNETNVEEFFEGVETIGERL
jgi:hypothetical protein